MTSNDMTVHSSDMFEIQEEKPDSHSVYKSFAATATQYKIIQDYRIKCQCLPTLWRLQILFRQLIKHGKTTCSISLERRDPINRLVEVVAKISFSDVDGRPLFACPTRIHCEGMLPREEIHGSTGGIFSYGQTIFVGIAIFIRYCHSESKSYSIKALSTDMKRKLFLKMH